jgi:hypothetical protein
MCVFIAMGTCLLSYCPETAVVYSPISQSLHINGCTHYSIHYNFLLRQTGSHVVVIIIHSS